MTTSSTSSAPGDLEAVRAVVRRGRERRADRRETRSARRGGSRCNITGGTLRYRARSGCRLRRMARPSQAGRGTDGRLQGDDKPYGVRGGRRERRSTDHRGQAWQRPRLRAALPALQRRDRPLRGRARARPRPRRGPRPGDLPLGAAAPARDRHDDHVPPVDLRDREERRDRPLPPDEPRRGGVDPRRRRPAAGRPAAARRLGPHPARERDPPQGALRPAARRVRWAVDEPPPRARPARARGPLLPRDRAEDGHDAPGRRERAVPRPPPSPAGVRAGRGRRVR